MSRSKVTNWYRWCTENEVWEFNHQENGWVNNKQPVPKFPSQKSWNLYTWRRDWDYSEINNTRK